jgi:hypothetical protein
MSMTRRTRPGATRLLWLVAALTTVHWAILILGLPVLERLPGWFFPLREKPAGAVWLLALLVAASLAVLLLTTRFSSPASRG